MLRKFDSKRMSLQGTGGNCTAGSLSSVPLTKVRKRRAMHVICMEERRSACGVLVGKPEEKRPLGRLRRRW
jgi:hypothetical protein